MKAKKGVVIPLIITIILLIAVAIGYWYIYDNDYVLKINGQKVTMIEFNTYLNLQKEILEQQYGENVWNILIKDAPAIEAARDGAKQAIIDTKVKVQKAKEMNVSLTSEEKKLIRTAVEYNGQDIIDEYGITFEELLRINEEYAIISKLELELFKQTDHSSHTHGKVDIESYEKGEEIGTTFDSRHILFNTKNLNEDEANQVKIKAQDVLKRIKTGEDFATLATEFSEDPGSKDNGGLYEGIEVGSFVSEYEKAVMAINDGEVYPELVESPYGYHIIKREKVNTSEYLSSNETQELLTTELETEAQKWIEEATIEVNEQQYNSAQ